MEVAVLLPLPGQGLVQLRPAQLRLPPAPPPLHLQHPLQLREVVLLLAQAVLQGEDLQPLRLDGVEELLVLRVRVEVQLLVAAPQLLLGRRHLLPRRTQLLLQVAQPGLQLRPGVTNQG